MEIKPLKKVALEPPTMAPPTPEQLSKRFYQICRDREQNQSRGKI